MYYQEWERLVNEHPDLEKVISKVDDSIRNLGLGSMLYPENVANIIREKESQVTGILKKLEEYGLLRQEEMIQCPRCSNLMPQEFHEAVEDRDEYLCSQCEVDMVKQRCKQVQIYRINVALILSKEDNGVESFPEPGMEANSVNQRLPDKFLENVYRQTPLLRYYSRDERLQREKPFNGKRAIIVLHFLRDLIPFMESLFSLGLYPRNTVLFYKSYPYPQREAIGGWLENRGCQVLSLSKLETYLNELSKISADDLGKIIIIEDGGFCVPLIHRQLPSLLDSTIGAVEQTTRGIMNAEAWEEEKTNKIQIPVLSVAGSRLKADFEPPYITKAVVNNISRMLPNMSWNGKEIGLLGFGTIGQELAEWLLRNGANVTVFEPSGEKALLAQQKGGIRCADKASDAASNKHFVIGATGRQSIDSSVISRVRHNTYLVSASSEQYEIDQDQLWQLANEKRDLLDDFGSSIGTDFVLAPDDRCIHLLANGYPVNFWGMESMPEEASDLIMSMIFLAAVELACGNYQDPGINKDAVNELTGEENYSLARKFLEIRGSI